MLGRSEDPKHERNSDPIRVGLIGANIDRHGWAVRAHAPAIGAHASFILEAVATRLQPSAEKAAQALGASSAYSSIEEMMADPRVDLVVVGVNVRDHAALIRHARSYRKHVLCEWPLGIDAAESTSLADSATGHTLEVIGLQARQSPAVRHARALLSDGYVGRLLDVSVRMSDPTLGAHSLPELAAYTADRCNGVSVLTVPGSHILDTAMYLAGELDTVSARALTLTPEVTIIGNGSSVRRTSHDHCVLHGVTSEGALLAAHLRSGCPTDAGAEIELRGDEGMLKLTTHHPTQFQMSPLRLSGARGNDILAPIAAPGDAMDHVPRVLVDTLAENLVGVYDSIARTLSQGAPPPPGFAYAAWLHRFVETAERSSMSETAERAVG